MPAAVEHDAAEEGAKGGGEQACEDVVRHDVADRVRCKRVPRYVCVYVCVNVCVCVCVCVCVNLQQWPG